jgi:hypothetical protein
VYDFSNFCFSTIANFVACKIPDRNPDFISSSGSAYWDEIDRVVRRSDHWGIVASCRWQIWSIDEWSLCGECLYSDFRKINDD